MIHHEERFLHDESSITKGWGYESLKSAIVPKQLGQTNTKVKDHY